VVAVVTKSSRRIRLRAGAIELDRADAGDSLYHSRSGRRRPACRRCRVLLPSPADVTASLIDIYRPAIMYEYVWLSLSHYLVGVAIGAVTAW